MQKYDENGNYIGYEISYTSNYKDMNGYTIKMINSDAYYCIVSFIFELNCMLDVLEK